MTIIKKNTLDKMSDFQKKSFQIYVVLAKRRRNGRRTQDDNLSMTLMAVVGTFLVCNVPRIFLNMHEITVIKEIYFCR